MDLCYVDLTEEEEANLPLPDGWITMIKIPSPIDGTTRAYKNVRLGIESSEHPFILQAQNNAKKVQLPSSWSLKSVTASDGAQDVFYYNSEMDFSMWDHPFLREQLCQLLAKAGHNPTELGIKKEARPKAAEVLESPSKPGSNLPDDLRSKLSNNAENRSQKLSEQRSVRSQSSVTGRSVQSGRSSDVVNQFEINSAVHEEDELISQVDQEEHFHAHHSVPAEVVLSGHPDIVSPLAVENFGRLYLGDLGTENESRRSSGNRSLIQSDVLQQNEGSPDTYTRNISADLSPAGSSAMNSEPSQSVVDNTRDWGGILDVYKDPGLEYADKISHRVRHIKPPVTISGIRVLREDVMEANERVHQLLIKMRSLLSVKSGIECSMLYHENGTTPTSNPTDNNAGRNNVTLASDVVTALRQRPEFIVLAMANSNNVRDGSAVMVQLAFTALHRILHPFSSDNSMTTALLLQGINYQLDELTAVEQVFSELDSKIIIARALFISDPDTVVRWDPLLSPMPTVPEVPSETVLASLLRVYAIRRDVTSYYRTIWKPILPGVVALLKHHGEAATDPNYHNSKPHVFSNIMAVAHRLLECTLSEKAVLIFPATATAVCRAVNEIGGKLAVHTYLFQLLILPNLLKVLAGDHESAENEDIYRVENVEEIVSKYYDSSFWFNKDPEGPALETETGILDPLRTLIWLVWRLYMCSVFMEDHTMTALTMKDFLTSSKPIALDSSAYAYPALRLRNMLMRLRRKIDRGCAFLLQMPMDAQGSEYLGVNEDEEGNHLDHQIQKLEGHTEMAQLLDRRLHTLHFKPNEMLNLTVASKYEIGALFSDIALAMEMHDQAANNPIYQAIAEYLNQNMDFDADDAHEHLMELTFLYVTDDFNGIEYDTQQYQQQQAGVGMAEEKNSEVHHFIAARYEQLIRGLRLCNRYEDSLIKMIKRAQNNQISSLFELAEDETWFHAPEFDPAVKSEAVKIARKHTAGSMGKQKNSHFGLQRAAQVPVFPLFSRHNPQDHHPNFRSMKQLQKDVFSSYRFHTSAPSANAGTTLARPKVAAPKVHPSSINVTTAEHKNTSVSRNRTRYTKIEVKPNAPILAPTKSFASHKLPERENPAQKHKKFLQSLRGHDIIPTDEFQMRYRKIVLERRRRKEQLQEMQHASEGRRSVLEPAYAGNPVRAPVGRVLKEFPEHLRAKLHRLQPQAVAPHHAGEEYNWPSDNSQQGYFPSSGSSRGGSRNGSRSSSPQRARPQLHLNQGQGYQEANYYPQEGPDTPQSLAQEIIRDYSNLFAPPPPVPSTVDTTLGRPQFIYTSAESHHRPISPGGTRPRSRSPGLPEPIPGFQSQFQSPTRSHLYRLTDNSEVELRRTLELRNHERNTDFEVSEPFSPTKSKVYPPKGLRVNRVPEFLYNEEISDYTRSRSNSRSMSRSNSFSFSPTRGRSRDNSFSNLTHICKRDPPPVGPSVEYEYEFEDVDVGYEDIEPPFQAVSTPVAASAEVAPVPEQTHPSGGSEAPHLSSHINFEQHIEQKQNFVNEVEPAKLQPINSLPKAKKVNVSLVTPKVEPVKDPSAGSVFPDNKTVFQPQPQVISIKPPVKRPQQALPQQAPAEKHAVSDQTENTPVVVRPRTAPTLEAHLSSLDLTTESKPTPPISKPAQPVLASAPPPALTPIAVRDVHSDRVNKPTPTRVDPEQQPPVVSAPSAAAVPKVASVGPGGKVSTQYSIQFDSSSISDGAHIYSVNAAHEEAYQRAKNSIHHGGASGESAHHSEADDNSESEEDGDDDEPKYLGYVPPRRPGMPRGMSAKSKSSMARRASKVLLDDSQVIQILVDGVQAIKVIQFQIRHLFAILTDTCNPFLQF